MAKQLGISFTALFLLSLVIPCFAQAGVIGKAGTTYPFAERDALSEIEESARKVDWQSLFAREKKHAENFRPASLPRLPRATDASMRNVSMTYTLENDIPDPRKPGKVLYPKGFAFNPLDYLALPGAIVFVDTSDKNQMGWLQSSPWWNDDKATIVLTGGDARKLEKLVGRPAYYDDGRLVERFDIRAVPSVARQNGGAMTVEEIYVENRSH